MIKDLRLTRSGEATRGSLLHSGFSLLDFRNSPDRLTSVSSRLLQNIDTVVSSREKIVTSLFVGDESDVGHIAE